MTQSYQPSTSAHRRRTDLMPTITFSSASPAGVASGSGFSRSSTPGNRMLRSPGKAVSMSRLDTLSKPRNLRLHNQNNMHASNAISSLNQTPKIRQNTTEKALNHHLSKTSTTTKNSPPNSQNKRNWSKSMTHLGPKKLSTPAAINTKNKGKLRSS